MNFSPLPFALSVLCVASACNAVEPKVGPEQDASTCSAAPAATSLYGSDYGAPASTDAGACVTPDPRCAADAGYEDGDCDRCEDTYCCTTRFDCYDNPGCFNADQILDSCTSAVAEDAGDRDAATVAAACWDAFVAAGPVEKVRNACQRAYCQARCGIP